MFGSTVGAGTMPGNSGVAGPNWIPRRFVWPHGGRRVFLIGSFTRWSAVIPMSPVQGYPTVFQVVCSLPPGYHQYKFNVDGEWKHDEQQPSVGGDYGIVNAICLVREQGNFFPILSAETPSRSHMEIDNAGFGHAEANPRLSDADLQAFRSRISILLSTHIAYDLLPESAKVIALDTTLSVEEAIHVLHEEGIPLAPLWDLSKCQFVGMLCAMDFILMLNELGKHGSNLTEEQLQTNTIAAWKEAKVQLHRTDGNGRTDPWRLIHAGPHECLKDVALKILQNKVATVPIIHIPSEDGSFPQLLYLASLSSILQCIGKHFQSSSASLPILQLPIGSIPIGTWVPKAGESNKQPLVMLRPNASLGDALSLLIQAEVSSIPIVDNNDSLLDIYSRSDVAALIKNKAYARINLKEFSIHQALLLRRNGNSPYGHPQSPRCHTCLRSDPLHKVMEQLAYPGVRRLVIVEGGSRRVEGIISLSDVFRFLLG